MSVSKRPAGVKRPGRQVSAARKVPTGGRVSGQSRVSGIQRQRILVAMAQVTAERGVGQVTVAHIVARSGVSRRTFYELFADREECFLAALDQAIAHATGMVLPAYAVEGSWRERIRSSLAALLRFVDEEPAQARLCIVESLGAGPEALERRTRVVHALIATVEEGRGQGRVAKPPPLAAEGVVGAVLAIVHARLVAPEGKLLSGLLPALMAIVVHPYLGQAAAEKELSKPAPLLNTNPRARRDPLEDLDMRLTYRTVRVLIAIAGHPQASNREIATAADIADQGQISKLLTRLQNLGLIRNEGEGQAKGGPNAWALTGKGQEVERSIRTDGP
jgi:AcrR family transcriptional regulator